ncbi:MAG TPA: efflux RND transporter permease subunit [Campylobacterales bacterium]|nr:efflux RND transporter permease subunit [Campylobacterales bacterium]
MEEKDVSHIAITDYAGKLAKSFIYNPLTPILAVFLLAIGYLSLVIMPREEDPQIAISGGTVIVPLPGATPSEIDNIIVKPLERKLREISGVEHIYGVATNNAGIINVMYKIGENREDSNLKLYDKVMQNMELLPKGAMQPLIKPFDIDIDVPIVTVAFYLKDSSKLDRVDLFKKVRDIQQSFNEIENVSKTTLKGEHKEQYSVKVDLYKLSGYHLSLGQIMNALKSLAVNVPDVKNSVTGGRIMIFGIKNAINSIEDVGNVIVASYMNSPVYLKDVATVEKTYDVQNYKSAEIMYREGDKFSTTKEQITLTVSKLKGTNAVNVALASVEKLATFEEELNAAGIGYMVTRNYGQRADEAVNELVHHLVITIIIIAIVLALALGWRESLIVTFTVPAILAITLFIAYLTGQTINRITLFAFLLSLGLLVDAAIIVIENIHRHMHAHDAVDREKDEIMITATDEIGAPTNIATLAIIMTMVPMAFVGGMMGEFMKPIPYNVPVALFASLVVAYIFTPYMANIMLKKPTIHHHKHHFQKDKLEDKQS